MLKLLVVLVQLRTPVANSSGSVTNQLSRYYKSPYITNTYGGGIQCQNPTLNITPFITGSASAQKPFEGFYDTPVYDMRDIDEDGAPDNPGTDSLVSTNKNWTERQLQSVTRCQCNVVNPAR